MLDKNRALQRIYENCGQDLARQEGLQEELLRAGLEKGSMVLLANPAHQGVKPTIVGQPARIKVNANLGTSGFVQDLEMELHKIQASQSAGAHTVMDLSTAGDLDLIRQEMLHSTSLPLGTVPLYSVAQRYLEQGKSPRLISKTEILEEIAKQAEQGVDFMTLHCGVTRQTAALAGKDRRCLGIVSRGGALLARWMQENVQENPLYEEFEQLLKICKQHNVVLSLGDGLRPGAGQDAGDSAQWAEVIILGELVLQARQAGVQAMVEGPGHVPLNLIQSQMQGMKRICQDAPLYVLGPLSTDIAPGYDHISGAIGGAWAGFYGADFLCYVTPAEHLTLPDQEDVRKGIMASLLAAHSAEVALGRSSAQERNQAMSRARADLDWERMQELALDPELFQRRRQGFSSKQECAMCGEFCAVRLLS
ncbi:MAG: phosphomethylpyrimidine synthase ThiC [Thermodesulfobacteriota bacterium]